MFKEDSHNRLVRAIAANDWDIVSSISGKVLTSKVNELKLEIIERDGTARLYCNEIPNSSSNSIWVSSTEVGGTQGMLHFIEDIAQDFEFCEKNSGLRDAFFVLLISNPKPFTLKKVDRNGRIEIDKKLIKLENVAEIVFNQFKNYWKMGNRHFIDVGYKTLIEPQHSFSLYVEPYRALSSWSELEGFISDSVIPKHQIIEIIEYMEELKKLLNYIICDYKIY